MPTCSFCRKSYKEPRGLTIFTFDGRAIHYCSSKCRRNQDLGREARKLNWVKRRGFFKSGKSSEDFEEENHKKNKENSEK